MLGSHLNAAVTNRFVVFNGKAVPFNWLFAPLHRSKEVKKKSPLDFGKKKIQHEISQTKSESFKTSHLKLVIRKTPHKPRMSCQLL